MLTQQQVDHIIHLANNFESAIREHDDMMDEETQEMYDDSRAALVEAIQQLKEPAQ